MRVILILSILVAWWMIYQALGKGFAAAAVSGLIAVIVCGFVYSALAALFSDPELFFVVFIGGLVLYGVSTKNAK